MNKKVSNGSLSKQRGKGIDRPRKQFIKKANMHS